jgi:Protein of unknown function (DUF2917)
MAFPIRLAAKTRQLARRELLTIDPLAVAIACDSGSLWITQDRDPRDIFIGPGQQFWPQPGRRAIAYALMPSTVHFSH